MELTIALRLAFRTLRFFRLTVLVTCRAIGLNKNIHDAHCEKVHVTCWKNSYNLHIHNAFFEKEMR